MLDCLRRLTMFGSGYKPVETSENIEMMNLSSDIGTIKMVAYFSENGKRLYRKSYDSLLKFEPTGLVIEEFHLKYEWIASFRIINNVLILLTFTDIVDNKVRKCDKLSYIVFYFDNNQFGPQFQKHFIKNVMIYMKKGKYDVSISNMDSFKRVRSIFFKKLVD